MELRIVIWETKEIPFADIEETSDIYVKVFIDENTKKSTDIHYRCQTGCVINDLTIRDHSTIGLLFQSNILQILLP